jgi:hypothetical protein
MYDLSKKMYKVKDDVSRSNSQLVKGFCVISKLLFNRKYIIDLLLYEMVKQMSVSYISL